MHFEEKPPNHERWIISYADFTTLLLATFVVMYAVSSINSSKFQEMAEAFSTAFIGRTVTLDSSGLGAPNKAPFDFMPSPVHVPVVTRENQIKNLPPSLRQAEMKGKPSADGPNKNSPIVLKEGDYKVPATPSEQQESNPRVDAATQQAETNPRSSVTLKLQQDMQHRAQNLNAAYENLKEALATLIGKGEVHVSLQSLGVVIDINEVLLFNSGKALLTPKALPLVDQIAGILKTLPYQIQVNGFTDNAPIHNPQFDSNWDLSATRAISVVKRFVASGVDPALVVGAGFGEFHPIATNSTPEGKATNRRVSVVVVSPVDEEATMKSRLFGAGEERGAPRTPAEPAPANAASETLR